jgi:hypothetical protein
LNPTPGRIHTLTPYAPPPPFRLRSCPIYLFEVDVYTDCEDAMLTKKYKVALREKAISGSHTASPYGGKLEASLAKPA